MKMRMPVLRLYYPTDIDFELKMAEKSVDLQRQEGYNILILTVSYEVTNAKPQ